MVSGLNAGRGLSRFFEVFRKKRSEIFAEKKRDCERKRSPAASCAIAILCQTLITMLFLVLAATLQATPIDEVTIQRVTDHDGVAKACGWKADDPAHANSEGCAIPFPRGCHIVLISDMAPGDELAFIQNGVDACLAGQG